MWTLERVTIDTRADAVRLLARQFEEHAIAMTGARLDDAVAGLLAEEGRGAVLVAREGEWAVGVAALTFTWSLEHGGRVAWLEELYVVPERRGTGIGTALLARARELVSSAGCRAIDLEVTEDHRRAERLYERAGFRPLHRARWALVLPCS